MKLKKYYFLIYSLFILNEISPKVKNILKLAEVFVALAGSGATIYTEMKQNEIDKKKIESEHQIEQRKLDIEEKKIELAQKKSLSSRDNNISSAGYNKIKNYEIQNNNNNNNKRKSRNVNSNSMQRRRKRK
jgi:hypothetical protein